VHLAPYVILYFFSIKISIEDLRFHKIRNILLLNFFILLFLHSILVGNLFSQMFSGFIFFSIFTILFLVGFLIPTDSGIGFGDVKLLTVLAFGFIDVGFRQIEIYFLSLWCALFLQVCLHYIHKRKFLSPMAMAPSIFLAVWLYLCAPIGLLLPQ
jgi:Flp pilus assembly protein protease CpaA